MRTLRVLLLSLSVFVSGAVAKGTSGSHHSSSGSRSSKRIESVRGYTRKNGTHVKPYKRTSPNGTQRDNFSTKGNVNPYTGKKGTKTPKH